MFVDLDKRDLMTISDVTPAEARTLMNALMNAIDDTEQILFEEGDVPDVYSRYTGELRRLKRMAVKIGVLAPGPTGKRPETVGEARFR